MLYEPLKRVARLHVDVSAALFGVNMLYSFLDDRGRIVERGRHGELLAQGRTYSHIAQTQFPRDAVVQAVPLRVGV